MMKKIFIVGLIVCSFFVVSISSVVAADETHTVDDGTGDVTDYAGDPVSKNNLDLKKLTFTKNNEQVQVELKIELATGGIIQNSDYVYYEIILVTSENRYDGYYSNNSCIITDFEQNELEDVEYSGDGTSTLTISFNLYSDDERYMSLYAVTSEITEDEEGNYYFDVIPEEEYPTAYATFLETGKTGESIEFSAEAEYGKLPYSWNWDFGDGETSDEPNTNHTYTAVGTYKVIVLVTDNNDYSDVYYGTIEITAGDGGDQNGGDNNGGDNGGEQESSNSGLILFVVIIAIIAIAGIAVVVYIIRR